MIKKYKKYIKESPDYNYDENEFDHDNEFDPRDDHNYDQEDDNGIDNTTDNFDDGMEDLCQTIESLYERSGLQVSSDYNGLDIEIFVFLDNKENLKTVIKAFDVSNKLKNDILPQYDSEFEIYENKKWEPIILFTFNYADNPIDKNKDYDKKYNDRLDPFGLF